MSGSRLLLSARCDHADESVSLGLTTPDIGGFHQYDRVGARRGNHVAYENIEPRPVSIHNRRRTELPLPSPISAAIHLDYHATMEEYFALPKWKCCLMKWWRMMQLWLWSG
jgi:hypothetical protein